MRQHRIDVTFLTQNIKPSNKGKHPAKKPKIIAPDLVEDDDDTLTIADASFKERDHLEVS